jgi:hypothetical protein
MKDTRMKYEFTIMRDKQVLFKGFMFWDDAWQFILNNSPCEVQGGR